MGDLEQFAAWLEERRREVSACLPACVRPKLALGWRFRAVHRFFAVSGMLAFLLLYCCCVAPGLSESFVSFVRPCVFLVVMCILGRQLGKRVQASTGVALKSGFRFDRVGDRQRCHANFLP